MNPSVPSHCTGLPAPLNKYNDSVPVYPNGMSASLPFHVDMTTQPSWTAAMSNTPVQDLRPPYSQHMRDERRVLHSPLCFHYGAEYGPRAASRNGERRTAAGQEVWKIASHPQARLSDNRTPCTFVSHPSKPLPPEPLMPAQQFNKSPHLHSASFAYYPPFAPTPGEIALESTQATYAGEQMPEHRAGLSDNECSTASTDSSLSGHSNEANKDVSRHEQIPIAPERVGSSASRQITVRSINQEYFVWINVTPTETGQSLAEKIHTIATFRTRKILSITTAAGRQIPIDHRPVFGSWMDMEEFEHGERWTVEWGGLDKGVMDKFLSRVKGHWQRDVKKK